MKTHDIKVYTTVTCDVCQMTKNFLNDMNLEFEEINVTINPVARLKLMKETKKLTVPQVKIDGIWVSGFDPVKMLEIIAAKNNGGEENGK